MVVESIIAYASAERRPEEMLFYGFIVTTISLFLALWVFPSYASFAMVTFVVMSVLPLMNTLVRFERERKAKGWRRWVVHEKSVPFFVYLFLGFVLAFMLWFLLLPPTVTNSLFFLQINTLTEINSPTAAASSIHHSYGAILWNNLRILSLSLLFSLIFGTGAIFILVWNASVLGAAMGMAVSIAVAASGEGSASYLGAFSFALVRFLIHGLPEITAYFLGGLGGGIFSFAILDYSLGLGKFLQKIKEAGTDTLALFLAGAVLLVIAAVIEVFVTPLLFS